MLQVSLASATPHTPLTSASPQRALDLLKKQTERWRVSLFGDRLHVITGADVESGTRQTAETLEKAGIRVISAREDRFSMEDVFISVVEEARQPGQVSPEERSGA